MKIFKEFMDLFKGAIDIIVYSCLVYLMLKGAAGDFTCYHILNSYHCSLTGW